MPPRRKTILVNDPVKGFIYVNEEDYKKQKQQETRRKIEQRNEQQMIRGNVVI